MATETHVAGIDLEVNGEHLIQRCAWCGAVLLLPPSGDGSRTTIVVREKPATFPIGELVRFSYDGPAPGAPSRRRLPEAHTPGRRMSRPVVLSPHLDDAVLSAWSILRDAQADESGAVVVNVFDGVPPEGTLSLWDKVCGATSSAEQVRARLAEDRAVLSSLDAEIVSLGLLDDLNRGGAPVDLEEYLRPHIAAASAVYAPLAGGPRPHPDHRRVRDAALRLLDEGAIDRLYLYADIPYCVKGGGWPRSLTGTHDDPPWLGRALRESRLGAWLFPTPVVLSPDDRERKLSAMRGYATQFVNLDRRLRVKGLVSDPEIFGREVFWRSWPAAAEGAE